MFNYIFITSNGIYRRFCEQLIILVHGKAILNGSLDEIKENYAKKNILIKGENIKVSDITKIKGVTSIDKKANEIVVHIENIDIAPKYLIV